MPFSPLLCVGSGMLPFDSTDDMVSFRADMELLLFSVVLLLVLLESHPKSFRFAVGCCSATALLPVSGDKGRGSAAATSGSVGCNSVVLG